MSGIHVLMTADAVGGVWQYALELARELSAADVRTTLAVLGPAPGGDQAADARAVPNLTLRPLDLPLDWTADRQEDVETAAAAVADLATGLGVDLVHLNSVALAAGGGFTMPVVAVCHSCLATWWDAVRGTESLPEDFVWRVRMGARGMAAADALLAPTAAFAQATARAYGLAQAPIVVRNGRTAPATREEPGGAPAGDFVFTAGRLWDEGKNVAAIDRAAARISLPVIAAGPTVGPNGARIALEDVVSLGRLGEEEIAAWLGRRPIFVSMARYEPFGLAVLEAAQAGCPLILSDMPTFVELWGGAAEFVDLNDDEALAAAIHRVAHDGAHRRRLADAARERAAQYTPGTMAEGALGVYRTLLSPANQGPPRRQEARV
ncbi:glycosyltransferase family 4 protein [Salinarimonas soli]|uniref:Glycosyltransferase family 4 protein n=1 Tax=Salinarimonas soli TaxID=1638099 RepID=A0A5B2VJ25_9HYPH|nr:glycosyltransferase family 4 protein [Salinarimonas soli]KAA2238197.1 glycosyltransferase family 4 protein [Salinarimonas soli]